MTQKYSMTAEKREMAGKGIARALRRDGKIPSVIYGGNKEPAIISLDDNASNVIYNKGHMFTSLCEMDVAGKNETVLARDIQVHPVTGRVIHVDFLRVTAKTTLAVHVPVHFINEEECPGLKKKGVLNITRHDVELICKATDIPESLVVDLTGIEIGQAVRLSHADLPKGATPVISDRDFTIAMMGAPKVAAEEDEETEASAEGEESAEGEATAE